MNDHNLTDLNKSIEDLIDEMKTNLSAKEEMTNTIKNLTDSIERSNSTTNGNTTTNNNENYTNSNDNDSSTAPVTEATGVFGKLTSTINESIRSFDAMGMGGSMATQMAAAGESSMFLTTSLNSTSNILGRLGPQGMAFQAALKIATFSLRAMIGFVDESYKSFSSFSEAGFQAEGGMFGLQKTANNMRIDFEYLQGIVQKNSDVFTAMSTSGLAEFSNQVSELRSSNALANLGYTAQQTGMYLSDYYQQQLLQGKFDKSNLKTNKKSAKKYLYQLDSMSKALGISREELSSAFSDISKSGDTAALATMASVKFGEEQSKQLMATLTKMNLNPEEIADALNFMVNGVTGEAMAEMQANYPQIGAMFTDMSERAMQGTYDQKAFKQIGKQYVGDMRTQQAMFAKNAMYAEARIGQGMMVAVDSISTATVTGAGKVANAWTIVNTKFSNFMESFKNMFADGFGKVDADMDIGEAISVSVKNFTSNVMDMIGFDTSKTAPEIKQMAIDLMDKTMSNFGKWMSTVPDMLPTAGELTAMILSVTSQAGEMIAYGIKSLLVGVGALMSEVDWGKATSQILAYILLIPKTLVVSVGGLLMGLLSGIAKLLLPSKFASQVDNVVSDVMSSITSILDFPIDLINSFVDMFKSDNTMDSIVSDAVSTVSGVMGVVWDSVIGSVSDLYDGIVESSINMWRSLTQPIYDSFTSLMSWFGETFNIDSVLETLSKYNPYTLAYNWFTNVISGIGNVFDLNIDVKSMETMVSDLWNNISDYFSNKIDELQNALLGAKDSVVDFLTPDWFKGDNTNAQPKPVKDKPEVKIVEQLIKQNDRVHRHEKKKKTTPPIEEVSADKSGMQTVNTIAKPKSTMMTELKARMKEKSEREINTKSTKEIHSNAKKKNEFTSEELTLLIIDAIDRTTGAIENGNNGYGY